MPIQHSESKQSWPRFLPYALLFFYAILCTTVWTEPDWRPGWDSAIYLLTAKSLAAGEGYTYLDQPFFLRPPGFSWLLSLHLSDSGYDFESLNRLIMFFAATTTIAVYWMASLRYSRWIAISTALLAGTSPFFVRNFNGLLSEFPFMTMLILGIALLERARSEETRAWAFGVAGALSIAAALHLRSAALLLLPGMFVAGIQASRGRMKSTAFAPVAIVAVLAIPWLLYTYHAASVAPAPNEQLLLHSYSTAMFHVDAGDPNSPFLSMSDWMTRFEENGRKLLNDFGRLAGFRTSLRPGWPAWVAWPFGTVLVVLFALGGVGAIRKGMTLGEWFFATYLLFVLTYFQYAERLLLPLVPFLYLYLVAGCGIVYEFFANSGVLWLERPGIARLALAPVLLLTLLINHSERPRQLNPLNWFRERSSAEQQSVEKYVVAKWIEANTAPEAVILCKHGPILAVLTGRRAYSYRFALDENLLHRYPSDYVLFDAVDRSSFPKLYRHLARVAWDRSQLLPNSRGRRVEVFRITGRP